MALARYSGENGAAAKPRSQRQRLGLRGLRGRHIQKEAPQPQLGLRGRLRRLAQHAQHRRLGLQEAPHVPQTPQAPQAPQIPQLRNGRPAQRAPQRQRLGLHGPRGLHSLYSLRGSLGLRGRLRRLAQLAQHAPLGRLGSQRGGLQAGIAACLLLCAMTALLALFAMKTGSIALTWRELFSGLFFEYDPRVEIVYDLRFPRIIVAMLSGGALSCSGLLLQAALKNPLADPGIIGISGGAAFTAALIAAFFPALFFSIPVFAFAGGILASMLIQALAWKGGLSPVRFILVGIAISAVFSGLLSVLGGMGAPSGVTVTAGGLSQRSWGDVRLLAA
ncbi:MAG: iron ABC transporter permease, partial [Clostridiales bacterium]|nr:iron ABC transporter permease [Clostridiales bacterium]